MEKMSRNQQKAVGAAMNEAGIKMVSPVSMFGSMGANPNINFLTNANALAAQQLAQQNVAPMQQPQVTPSMGIFGDADARNRSLYPSALMAHDDVKSRIEAKKAEIEKAKSEGGDPDIVYELKSDLMDLEKELKTAKEEHEGSPN